MRVPEIKENFDPHVQLASAERWKEKNFRKQNRVFWDEQQVKVRLFQR
jgi:hypothetical protein